MPMYQPKPIELRMAHEDNIDDIASWCSNDYVELGMYYDEGGGEYSADEVEMYYEEIG